MRPVLFSVLLLSILNTSAISATGVPEPISVYYGWDHWRQSVDVYVPVNGCPPFPVVVYIPGGGWIVGDSTQVQPFLQPLLERGFAVASVNHRWSFHAAFPAQIHDCKGAIRFLRHHANTFNLDPTRVAAFGPSSGGHLAALLGTSGDVASLEGEVGGNLDEPSIVQVVADIFGPTDLFELGLIHNAPDSIVSRLFQWPIQDIIDNINNPDYADLVALVHSANPITHVTPDDPPFYIAHGDADDVVPLSQSQLLVNALQSVKVPYVFLIEPGAGHELSMSYYLAAMDYMAAELDASPYRAADITCDGVVNVNDLLLVINSWGICEPLEPCPADITHDGYVNVNDLLAIINDWG